VKAGSLAVVDTNVLLVASGQHLKVSPECVIACVNVLGHLRKSGCVVIDDGYEILNEYGQNTKPNSVGDGFLKWLHQNKRNSRHVEQVHINKHTERGFSEFPDDAELNEFDHTDRKFVAVAVAHPKRPPILQGTDSKWIEWSVRLSVHEIKVEFLCPADVARFIKRKRSHNSRP
jgi:hypothetical protein